MNPGGNNLDLRVNPGEGGSCGSGKDQDVANEIWDFNQARGGSYEAFGVEEPIRRTGTHTLRFAQDNPDRTSYVEDGVSAWN